VKTTGKMNFRELMRLAQVGTSDGFCEHCNETPGFIKESGVEFLDYLRDC
jgi:hypothetical protein